MILHVNGRFYGQRVTGVQRYARELVAAMDALAADGKLPPPLDGVVAHLPGAASAPAGLRAVEIRRHRPGNGHAWEQLVLPRATGGGLLFCPGNTAPLASLARGRVVVTVHDLSYRYFPEAYSLPFRAWYHLLIPVIMRRAVRVITVSQSERAAITAAYPMVAPRLVAIQNGAAATLAALTPPPPLPPLPEQYVLYVGSLSRRKNFPGVLRAFERLAGRAPGLRLVVAGGTSGVFASAGTDVAAGARERVTFLGQVDDPRVLAAAYRGAQCLVFPSFYEASPLPPTEAMALGCPLVAADIPSLRERCGDAALYCDPHDADSIAHAVRRVLDDPALAADLRRKGAARAAALTWAGCAARTLAVLAEAACA
ncbi:MAG TPA: glycosyltransferase family 1 protein [Gemmatimonadales bacterium]|nr:glycosyltransferase family 1 protein [Gemmatimonadales bacterium]